MPDSSFEAQQKQLVAPWEVPWQISETPSKAAGRVLRLLRLLRGAGNMPDGSFEAPIETGCGAAEVPDSSFEAPIETGCGASEVPDSSFEAYAGRVLRLLRLLRLLRGAGDVPDGSFKAR